MLEGLDSARREVTEKVLSHVAARSDTAAAGSPRFVRRTILRADEYRKNFRQIDADVIAVVASPEADGVTPLMSKIYLRLVSAPAAYWEREGVLYIGAGEDEGRPVKASKVLYGLLGVASATAHKALRWMHEQGVIGYYAGKNGAGIRIFLNRASASIGSRGAAAGEKILAFTRGSNGVRTGSKTEPRFKDSYAVSEVLEKDLNPRAPENGAEKGEVGKPDLSQCRITPRTSSPVECSERGGATHASRRIEFPVEEIVARLRREIEPSLKAAAQRAAAEEHERTREWLESRGLPKAARVAQREAYNVLRKCGALTEAARASHAEVGRGRGSSTPPAPHVLADEEIAELAQVCVALLETQGQPVEVTLAQMSAAAGGLLLPEDAPRLRDKINSLTRGSSP